MARMRFHPGDTFIEPIDDLHARDGVEIFSIPVFLGRLLEAAVDRHRIGIAAQLAIGAHRIGELRDEGFGHCAVDDHAFGRAAHAGPAQLGVADHLDRLVEIGGGVDIAVTIAVEVEQRGHAGLVADQFDQPASAARDHQIDEFIGLEQRSDGVAVGRADRLHRILGQAGSFQPGAHAIDDHARRIAAFAAAAQDHRIARFEAERAGVGADIGARFVNHADHADRHGDAFDGEAVGPLERRQLAADGVGQFGDFLQRAGHARDPLLGQAQTVDEAFGLAAFDALYILCIGFEQVGRAVAQRLRGFAQRGVFRLGAGRQQAASCLARALAEVVDMQLRVECLVGHSISHISRFGAGVAGVQRNSTARS